MKYLANLAGDSLPDLQLAGDAGVLRHRHPALGVEGVASGTQANDRPVNLGHTLDRFDQPCGRAHTDDQNPGGERIQGSRVTDLDPGKQPRHTIDNGPRGDPGGLVEIQDSLHSRIHVVIHPSILQSFVLHALLDAIGKTGSIF